MVFGVDCVVKDRWALVRYLYRADVPRVDLIVPEMCPMHAASSQGPWCQDSMHQGKMPQSIPCFVRNQCRGRGV